MTNSINIDLQLGIKEAPGNLFIPTQEKIHTWVKAVLTPPCEITVRIVDKSESAQLNEQYRKKTGPTNILSFPFDFPEVCLGDLIICAPLVQEEALAQGKTLEAHWAHLIIHGTLHLLGYDHETDDEAQIMETKEIAILAQLGYRNPYNNE